MGVLLQSAQNSKGIQTLLDVSLDAVCELVYE